ncbi:MAG: pseudouridine synthase [Patescibacteria group bacterium]
MQVRLNKHLADLGIASRRKADELIADGQVKVNGKIVQELGTKVDPEKDKVTVSEKVLAEQKELTYYLLNKPLGFVTSSAPTKTEKQIVVDLLPQNPRIFPVGRLDKDTTGLLILTNDGVLAYRLTHPKFECEKEYEVTVDAPLTHERIRKIEVGVKLERKPTQTTQVKTLGEHKARIILTEGKNRQVRKVFGKVGCEVLSLKRVRVKKLLLGDLLPGKFRKLTDKEVSDLNS